MTPFEALYGNRPTNEIDALSLPADILARLKTEKDLNALTGKKVENGSKNYYDYS